MGCLSIVLAFNGHLYYIPYLVLAAAFFDLFDGLAARMLGVSSDLGKELDSLADMVTFGVVPAVVLYHVLLKSFEQTPLLISENQMVFALPAFFIALFSAYRLAKFNIDTRQTKGFLGMPTPANTLFFLGLIAPYYGNAGILNDLLLNSWFLYALIPIFSYLLTSEVPMFSAKAKSFKWKDNRLTYTYATASVIILIIFGQLAFLLNILMYIIVSLIKNYYDRSTLSKN